MMNMEHLSSCTSVHMILQETSLTREVWKHSIGQSIDISGNQQGYRSKSRLRRKTQTSGH